LLNGFLKRRHQVNPITKTAERITDNMGKITIFVDFLTKRFIASFRVFSLIHACIGHCDHLSDDRGKHARGDSPNAHCDVRFGGLSFTQDGLLDFANNKLK